MCPPLDSVIQIRGLPPFTYLVRSSAFERYSTVYNKAKQIKSFVLSVMVGFALLCPAYSVLSDGNMVGVQIDDWVVMFSKTETSVVLGEFSITGLGTYNTIVTGLDTEKSYDAYLDGDKLDPPPVSNGNGLANFPLDLSLPGENYLVHIWDMSSEIGIATAEVSGIWYAGTYFAAEDILVEEGATLTLEAVDQQTGEPAPVVVKFAPSVQMEVRGTLVVNGSEGNNVFFTSVFDDDNLGEDLDGEGLLYDPDQDPASGDWKGILLNGLEFQPLNIDYEGIGQFNYSRIRYGGNTDGQASSNVYFFSSDLDGYFTNSISERSDNYGVKIMDCSPEFRYSRIAENDTYGIYIDGTAAPDLGTSDPPAPGNNSIRDNDGGNYQLYNDTSNAISAVSNYWGYTDPLEIDVHIYDVGGEVDFSDWLTEDPTMVVLSSFTVMIRDGKVILIWRTEAEIDNVGFAIYRSDTEDGDCTRIAFVPGAQDSETSNDYQFTDEQVQPGRTYYYYLEDVDVAGKRTKSDVIQVNLSALLTQTELEILPERNSLLDNYPNPSNPETWIPYDLAEAADVTIQIYDIRGHLIRTLHPGYQPAGFYLSKDRAAYWDGRGNTGERVSSGVYFYRLSAGSFSVVRKMVILR